MGLRSEEELEDDEDEEEEDELDDDEERTGLCWQQPGFIQKGGRRHPCSDELLLDEELEDDLRHSGLGR